MNGTTKGDHEDNDNDVTDYQTFCRALGEALRQQQQGQQHGTREEDGVLLAHTFRELHFDEPHGLSIRGIQLLTKALVSDTTPSSTTTSQPQTLYCLNDRFLSCLSQALEPLQREPSQPQSQQEEEPESPAVLLAAATTTATTINNQNDKDTTPLSYSQALAHLAWTIFGRIPWQVLTCTTSSSASSLPATIHALLGTYRGSQLLPTTTTTTTTREDDHEEEASRERTVDHQDHGDDHDHNPVLPVQFGTNGHAPSPMDYHDDLDEVWAEESDPSDYSYTDNDNDNVNNDNPHATEDWFGNLTDDTSRHDQPPPLTSYTDVAQAITNLLSQLTFTTLAPLLQSTTTTTTTSTSFTNCDWKRLSISETLVQLSLLLLLPSTNHNNHDQATTCPTTVWDELQLLCETPPPPTTSLVLPSNHWQRLALRPIHVFRDAAHYVLDITITTTSSTTSLYTTATPFLLTDYWQFLKALLQVDTVVTTTTAPSNTTTTNTTNTATSLAPATLLGLGLLSQFCNALLENSTNITNNHHYVMLRDFQKLVLTCCDELTHILEQVSSNTNGWGTAENGPSDREGRTTVAWAMSSVLQVLSMPPTSPTKGLATADYQVLLNSGLLGQWLQWWKTSREALVANVTDPQHQQHQQPPTDKVLATIHQAIQRSIFDMALVSPKLVGKYAWRYPGFASMVTTISTDTTNNNDRDALVDAFFWNLLSLELIAQEGPSAATGRVQWKAKPTNGKAPIPPQGPPSLSQCQDNARRCFQTICQQVVEVVSGWIAGQDNTTSCISGSSPVMSTVLIRQQHTLALFCELVDRLHSDRLLSATFTERLMADSERSLQSFLQEHLFGVLPGLLVQWKSPTFAKGTGKDDDHRLPKVKEDDVDEEEEGTQTDRSLVQPSSSSSTPTNANRLSLQVQNDSIVALRKSLKIVQSILDSAVSAPGDKVNSAFQRQSLSSKAD